MAAPAHASGEPRAAGAPHLTPIQVDRLREQLAEELASRRAALEELGGEAAGAEGTEREVSGAVAARLAQAIADLEAALARMDDGTYGTCVRCGAAIPFERLEAVPAARLCVACPEGRTSIFG